MLKTTFYCTNILVWDIAVRKGRTKASKRKERLGGVSIRTKNCVRDKLADGPAGAHRFLACLHRPEGMPMGQRTFLFDAEIRYVYAGVIQVKNFTYCCTL